jgi:hypothetical protein
MRALLTSLRYTVRLLRKSPTFTIAAVLILGVGIGANTAIFSLLDAVVLNPLPFPHPDRLVSIANTSKEISGLGVDLPDYVDFRMTQESFDELAVARETILDLSDSAGPQKLNAGFVSASLFTVTGQPFVIGRPFTDQEDRFGGPLLVVLSERFWRTHFESDPKVLGKNLTLSGRSYEIVGVCPTQVDDWVMDSPVLYVPIKSVVGADDPVKARDAHWLSCFGRLKPGVTMNQAETDLAGIGRTLQKRYPDINQGYGVRLMPLLDDLVGDAASNLWLPDYFHALQIPILRGRGFSAEDAASSQPVIIINEALASHYFPNEDPIGKQIIIYAMHTDNNVPRTIVGVAGNVLYDSPDSYRPAFDGYFPYSQRPMNNEALVLRASGDVATLVPAIRRIVASVDPDIPTGKITAFNSLIAARFTSRKTGMLLVSAFSAAALFLSAIGIYGTLAYTVMQRTRELGIRVSLGSTSLGILKLVLRDGLWVVGIGLLTGVLVALGVAGLLQSVLYGVSAYDPIAISTGILVLTVVTFIACLFPALRASRVDPIAVLRSE